MEIHRSTFLAICALYLTFWLTACKKDNEDKQSPYVHWQTPYEGAAFYYQGNIVVRAHVTDNKKLESVRVDVINSANTKFLQENIQSSSSGDLEIETTIYHDDKYLESGSYFVRITASDGENTTTAYRQITLYEAPRVLLKELAARDNGASSSIDSLNNGSSYAWFTTDGFAFGAIDSRRNTIIIGEANNNSTTVYELPELFPISGGNLQLPADDGFLAFYQDKKNHDSYITTNNGQIWKHGGNTYSLFADLGSIKIQHIYATDQYLYLVSNAPNSSAESYIYVYYRTTGAFFQSTSFNFEVKGIAMLEDENHMLLVGNENSNSIFKIYNNTTNALNSVFNFYDSGLVSGLCEGDDGEYYVSHSSGIAHYSSYLENYAISNTLNPSVMQFEEISGNVYVITNDGIRIMNNNCSQELDFIAGTEFKDVIFYYNK